MSFEVINPVLSKLFTDFKIDKSYIEGQGLYLYDEKGRQYLDFIAQYGAVPFGYNPPFITKAVKEFFDSDMPTLVQPSIPVKAVELAELLIKIAPGEMAQATFCQSGAEAVEAAIKLARSTTGKPKIVSTVNSFHGKTMGALSATGRSVYQAPFFLPAPDFETIPFNDAKALEAVFQEKAEEIAAFIVEPIQGEGGIVIPMDNYLKEAELLCRKYGVLLIVDEVQTGLGRTGYLWACQKEGVNPDILLLSKALGGGLVPIAVCLSSKKAWNDNFGKLHSSTFANNNFTCAVALAVIKELTANGGSLLRQAAEMGNYFLQQLNVINDKFPGVAKEIRGRGLMVGIEFNNFDGSESFSLKYLAGQGGFTALLAGYLLNTHQIRLAPFLNNSMTLRLEPALIVSKAEIDLALTAIEKIFEILYYRDYSKLFGYLVGYNSSQIQDFRHQLKPILASELLTGEKATEKFAFLIHYPALEDVAKNNASFNLFSTQHIENLLDFEANSGSEPEVLVHMPAIKSKAGKIAEGWLIGVPYSGKHIIDLPREKAVKDLRKAVDLAKELGAKIVGLGAYTSVVSRGGKDLMGRGVAITSGNSYTIYCAVEGLFKGAESMGINNNSAVGAVIGAAGSIGRVCAILLSDEVAEIYLVGNPQKEKASLRKLERLSSEIYKRSLVKVLAKPKDASDLKGLNRWLWDFIAYQRQQNTDFVPMVEKALANEEDFSYTQLIKDYLPLEDTLSTAPLKITVDLQEALTDSDMIISASNATNTLIEPSSLKSGAVICDVARPADVSKEVFEERNDVLVIEGGLVGYPDKISFGQNIGNEAGVNLACLSETMLLALEGDYRDISIGIKLPLEDVLYLKNLGEKHGFHLASPSNSKGPVTWEAISEIRNNKLSN